MKKTPPPDSPRYPRLVIDLGRIRANAERVLDACGPAVEVMGVTKGVGGSVEVAGAFVAAGVRSLGDARLRNLERLRGADLGVPLWLLRSPGPSEVDATIALSDGSLNVDPRVLRLLHERSRRESKRHRVLLMVDLETGREGIAPDDVAAICAEAASLEGLELAGLGLYFDFKSEPDVQLGKLETLIDLARSCGVPVGLLSGGSSNVLHGSVLAGRLPDGINHLRVGTAPLLGISTSYGPRVIEGWDRNTFLLEAEVIEAKRRRPEALLSLGHFEAPAEYLYPVDPGLVVARASSDHTLVDFGRAASPLETGDVVTFRLGYYAMNRLMLSPYTNIVYR